MNVQISPTEDSIREDEKIAAFWRAEGARFCFAFPFAASRGGALTSDEAEALHCQTKRLKRLPPGCINVETLFRPTRRDANVLHKRANFVCYPKDRVTFVSWQGNYHLCCNDYEKKHPFGSVFETDVDEAYSRKAKISPDNTPLCANCGLKGDLAPRDTKFYLGAAAYLVESALARLDLPLRNPDLLHRPRTGRFKK